MIFDRKGAEGECRCAGSVRDCCAGVLEENELSRWLTSTSLENEGERSREITEMDSKRAMGKSVLF